MTAVLSASDKCERKVSFPLPGWKKAASLTSREPGVSERSRSTLVLTNAGFGEVVTTPRAEAKIFRLSDRDYWKTPATRVGLPVATSNYK